MTANNSHAQVLAADSHEPKVHASTHEDGGSDELEITSLATSATDDSLVLAPDGLGGVEFRAETGGGGATDLIMRRYVRTGASYSITGAGSDSFADIDATNLKWTITATGKPIMCWANFNVSVSNAAGGIAVDIDIDGTKASGGAAFGLALCDAAAASEILPLNICFVTADLSAGSHTISFQWRQRTTSHTATLVGGSGGVASSAGIVELYAV